MQTKKCPLTGFPVRFDCKFIIQSSVNCKLTFLPFLSPFLWRVPHSLSWLRRVQLYLIPASFSPAVFWGIPHSHSSPTSRSPGKAPMTKPVQGHQPHVQPSPAPPARILCGSLISLGHLFDQLLPWAGSSGSLFMFKYTSCRTQGLNSRP